MGGAERGRGEVARERHRTRPRPGPRALLRPAATSRRVRRDIIRPTTEAHAMLRVLRLLTAGESHGQGLVAILDGIPSGLPILAEAIDRDLARRQQGYGRGGRMKIEQDRVQIQSGVRHGRTLGGPIALLVANRDWPNWEKVMAVGPVDEATAGERALTRPRPGHADLSGAPQ